MGRTATGRCHRAGHSGNRTGGWWDLGRGARGQEERRLWEGCEPGHLLSRGSFPEIKTARLPAPRSVCQPGWDTPHVLGGDQGGPWGSQSPSFRCVRMTALAGSAPAGPWPPHLPGLLAPGRAVPTKTGEGPKCGGIWGPMKVPSRSRPRARHAQAERPQGETLGAVTGGRVFPRGPQSSGRI